jgi:putative SOS response-associated peptidase YedK
MCGRFVQNFTFETLQRNFNFSTVDTDAMPNYNVAPTQEILTIIKHDNENKLERLHWGLVPFWAKDVAIGS